MADSISRNTLLFAFLWFLTLLILDLRICICRASSSYEAACIPSERHALLEFKHHLLDPSHRLASWSAHGDCCNWPSVVCSNVTGNVLELHLASSVPSDSYEYYAVYKRSRFGGEVHPSILDLKHLNYLDLSGNDFNYTQIPSFLGSMTSLTYLNLSRAGFGGSIPYQIGNLSNLLHLDLGGNDFNGSIPHQLGNLSNLLYLDLRGNDFRGSIPYQIGNLSNLLYLNLQGNDFSGSIPYQIGNLSNLLYLGLQGAYEFNMDELSIFVENLQWLSALSSLQHLELSFVNLSIAFDWLHVLHLLPSLRELHLLDCALHHHFQPSAINFSSLTILDISSSQNFGASFIPKWIFQLQKLVYLQLSYNQLQGSIPDGIQNLTLLQHLDLSENLFNSSIPSWLCSFSSLNFLGLSGNKLHGTISNAIGNLTSLVTLDLSSNQLEGKIPNSLGNLCNLKTVFFSNKKCNQQVSEILEIFSRCASHTLENLYIFNSQLSGHLTDQTGLFKNLVSLDLSYNAIQGTIPTSLRNLTSLKYLFLSKNKFSGNPFEILGSLSELQELYIEDNLFHGVVKEAHLDNFTHLIYFLASNNQLTLNIRPNWRPSFQFVRHLEMASWHLGQTFPKWLQSLKHLSYMDISNSSIFESIPTWFWGTYAYAYYLNLSHNCIKGEIHEIVVNSSNPMIIDLSSNQLSGQLPYLSPSVDHLDLSSNQFSGSTTYFLCPKQDETNSLEFLNLASNNLSGELPDCWMMWPYLMTLKSENNHLSGNLPISMGSLASLEMLHLHGNNFSGNFPSFLKNNSKLISLDLGENQFSGIIPSWIGQSLFNLKILRLRSNKFTGPIPQQICAMGLLQILDLAQNKLTGNIPKCVNHLSAMLVINTSSQSYIRCEGVNQSMSSLMIDVLLSLKGRVNVYSTILALVTSIDLSGNKLSGRIPIEITNLMGLRFLNLSNNLLSGQIPQSIGNMRLLETMDFSRNNLSGEIPPSISKLSFLDVLNLSCNKLTGKIPTTTQLQTFQASSFVGNDLCGPPLTINCITNGPNHNDKEASESGINWFFVSMALGFVVGFWVVVGPLLYHRSWRYTYFQFLKNMWYKL